MVATGPLGQECQTIAPAVLSHVNGQPQIGTIEVVDGGGGGACNCALADGDGGKAFMDYAGTPMPSGEFAGNNTLTGGTGRFTGSVGKAPFKCKPSNRANGQWTCDERLGYRLPSSRSTPIAARSHAGSDVTVSSSSPRPAGACAARGTAEAGWNGHAC